MKYVLRANSNEGVVYYMNAIMVTNQPEHARIYSESELEEAKADMEHFKMMFTRADNLHDFEIVGVSHPKLKNYQAYYLDRAICHIAYESRDIDRLVELNREWNKYRFSDVVISDDEAKELLTGLVGMVDEILYDVYTDSEGCTYNSIRWKDGGVYEEYIKKVAKD